MIVYSFMDDDAPNGRGEQFAGTLKEVRDLVRECLTPGDEISICKNRISGVDKERVVAMLNGEGWCSSSFELETWASTTCGDRGVKRPCPACRDGEGECERPVVRKRPVRG